MEVKTMNVKILNAQMDDLVKKGQMVDAVKQFYAETAASSDYGDVATASKQEMVEKMEGFLGAIAKVNEITHLDTLVDGNKSASRFVFDFDMKDNSHIHWHEIIKRDWRDGKVVNEEYFNAG
ncbi:hypothetical protein WIW50_04470 [Flavobacteriaceae bacterium 3-367]|uniref:hypothetical protein n=1 Tax=Eudoraea algarum TaxID=3417568 RepID=UPI00326F6CED